MSVSTEDRAEILDVLARYCWAVDEGDGETWAALWTEDGRFTGIPQPLVGREQLLQMPGGFYQMSNGKFRHHLGNIVIMAEADDTFEAKAYSVLTNWTDGASVMSFAKATFTFVRHDGALKIKALHADMAA